MNPHPCPAGHAFAALIFAMQWKVTISVACVSHLHVSACHVAETISDPAASDASAQSPLSATCSEDPKMETGANTGVCRPQKFWKGDSEGQVAQQTCRWIPQSHTILCRALVQFHTYVVLLWEVWQSYELSASAARLTGEQQPQVVRHDLKNFPAAHSMKQPPGSSLHCTESGSSHHQNSKLHLSL